MITFRNWQLKDQCIRLSVLKTFKWLKKFNSDLKITELRASQAEKWRGHWSFFWKPWMCAKSRRGNFYESAIFLGKSAKSELQTTIVKEFRIPSKEAKTNKGWLSGNPFGFNFNSSSWLKQMCRHIIWVLLVTSEDYWEVARIGAWGHWQPLLNLGRGDNVSRRWGRCEKMKVS